MARRFRHETDWNRHKMIRDGPKTLEKDVEFGRLARLVTECIDTFRPQSPFLLRCGFLADLDFFVPSTRTSV